MVPDRARFAGRHRARGVGDTIGSMTSSPESADRTEDAHGNDPGGAEKPPASLENLAPEPPHPDGGRGTPMPPELRDRYGGDLVIPIGVGRATLIANFVATIDGVVALGSGDLAGGGPISGNFEPDRFVMALLRAIADVLVVGAGTIAGTSSHQWTAAHLEPRHATAFGEWRAQLGLAPQPTVVIATGSGDVRLGRRGLDEPDVLVVFATTTRGAGRLARAHLPAHARVEVVGAGDRLTPSELMTFLASLGAGVTLTEGGPHLLGDLVAADAVDELFLTVAPQIVGAGESRLRLVEGLALEPAHARWHDLVSVKRSGSHLFLRYRRSRGE
jgi:riboflavin biosynthesis pyrimidine reductase